jgi:predicted nuclease of predicted toxin-antitoxin system
MKGLLLDQGLPRSTARLLIESGLAALHAGDVGLSRAADPEILEYARVRDLIVVTLDADFHMLLASTGAAAPSVIRLRRQRLKAKEAAIVIQAVLELGHEILDSGAVASATKTAIRFKRLPLRRPK